jgi:Flp pilus assembly protein TadG
MYRMHNAKRHGMNRWLRGQAMLETAVSIIVFLTLLLGVIDFGYGLYTYDLVSYAAKIGSRWAIVHGATSGSPATASDVQNYIATQIAGLDPSKMQVNTSWSPDNSPGSTVSVQVTYNFSFADPLVPIKSLTFNASSNAIVAQ